MSETNFTKLFSSITASTIWCESPETKVVWITMLAMSDAAGFVYASVPGLANISQVSIEKTQEALDKFLNPDHYSRDSENEGQRIEKIDGGWAILNHPKYRKLRSAEERRAYQREFMRKKRGKDKDVSSGVSNVSNCRPQLAQGEGEGEGDIKSIVVTSSKSPRCPYVEIQNLYNEKLSMLPRCLELNDDRKKKIKARWLNGLGSIEEWSDYFDLIASSRFLTGRTEKPFRPNIDWILKPANAIKIKEGNYTDSTKNSDPLKGYA